MYFFIGGTYSTAGMGKVQRTLSGVSWIFFYRRRIRTKLKMVTLIKLSRCRKLNDDTIITDQSTENVLKLSEQDVF